jgi:hypothetical protein
MIRRLSVTFDDKRREVYRVVVRNDLESIRSRLRFRSIPNVKGLTSDVHST